MVSKIKRNERGVEVKYKNRIEDEGFLPTECVDFGKKIDPTSRFETFKLVLALAAQHNLRLEHLDVKSAFLHGKNKEEVIIEQPRSYRTWP